MKAELFNMIRAATALQVAVLEYERKADIEAIEAMHLCLMEASGVLKRLQTIHCKG